MDQISEFDVETPEVITVQEEHAHKGFEYPSADDFSEIEYRPIPATRVLKVKVKARLVGPGRPMRHSLEGET